jgi:alpha-ketoglutarate-dependent 2,4-dichlorophenoxyacetate dioxygenase
VIGMALPAGRILLCDLQEHATQPEFVYRHAWRKGDLVLWDNRAVMHRGCRYDLSQVRDMRRTTVLDPASVNERDCDLIE